MTKSAAKTNNKTALLRALPSVDALLRTEIGQSVRSTAGAEQQTALAREVIEELRAEILAGSFAVNDGNTPSALVAEAEQRLAILNKQQKARGVRRVINATGVILHTNLGRAPFSDAARRAVAEARRLLQSRIRSELRQTRPP